MVPTLKRRAVLAGALMTGITPSWVKAQQRNDPANQEPTDMKIRITFDGKSMLATLYDNPSARDLASVLPLDLTIEDYGDNEKITYLPRKLTDAGSGPFGNERIGDLCTYAPWGNLVFYYGDYRYSRGLIRLGRFDDGLEPLLTRGKFPLRIEQVR